VLWQIKERFPKDFARLLSRVRMIVPLPRRKLAKGDLGEWLGQRLSDVYREAEFSLSKDIRENLEEWSHGTIELAEIGQVSESRLASVAAEEFGHACTRYVDIKRRQGPCDEWDSEAAADWYTYKWGFGRLRARHRKEHDYAHHGAGPGQTVPALRNGKTVKS
jgi:hypothetical protein